jgi:hypothetical protein
MSIGFGIATAGWTTTVGALPTTAGWDLFGAVAPPPIPVSRGGGGVSRISIPLITPERPDELLDTKKEDAEILALLMLLRRR